MLGERGMFRGTGNGPATSRGDLEVEKTRSFKERGPQVVYQSHRSCLIVLFDEASRERDEMQSSQNDMWMRAEQYIVKFISPPINYRLVTSRRVMDLSVYR